MWVLFLLEPQTATSQMNNLITQFSLLWNGHHNTAVSSLARGMEVSSINSGALRDLLGGSDWGLIAPIVEWWQPSPLVLSPCYPIPPQPWLVLAAFPWQHNKLLQSCRSLPWLPHWGWPPGGKHDGTGSQVGAHLFLGTQAWLVRASPKDKAWLWACRCGQTQGWSLLAGSHTAALETGNEEGYSRVGVRRRIFCGAPEGTGGLPCPE